jgi:predicted ribosomally synthesized peptide with nif11-like leader
MKNSSEFLHQIQNDPEFIERAQRCASDEQRVAFLRREGFKFTAAELEATIRSWPFFNSNKFIHKTKDRRQTEHYKISFQLTEINGLTLAGGVMVDLEARGNQMEFCFPWPPGSLVEISFILPSEDGNKQVRLSGKVVWSEPVPFAKRSPTGRQPHESPEQRHHEGNLPKGQIKSPIQAQPKTISDKEYFNIREFAQKVGVHWFTVWRWTVEHRIKFKQVKSGCKILIPASELSQFQSSPE